MSLRSPVSSLQRRRLLLATGVCCLVTLCACGFRPVHGTQYQSERVAATAALSEVAVSTNTSRLGELLGEELRDRLNPTRQEFEKRYRLNVAVSELDIPLFVAPDGTYGRGNIRFIANYRLIRIADNALVDSGSLTRMSSYAASETNAIYASYVAQQDARKRGITELANGLALNVSNRLNDASLVPQQERKEIEPDPMVELESQQDLEQMGIER